LSDLMKPRVRVIPRAAARFSSAVLWNEKMKKRVQPGLSRLLPVVPIAVLLTRMKFLHCLALTKIRGMRAGLRAELGGRFREFSHRPISSSAARSIPLGQ